MLCNKCKKNEATHFMEKNINGKVTKLALCSECAKDSDEFKYDPFEDFKPFNFFDSFFGFPKIAGETGKSLREPEKRCTLCASTFEDIVNAGRVGCAECYKVFANELRPTVRRIHGDRRHVGRRPGKILENKEDGDLEKPEKESRKDVIKSLKKELNEAIKTENFERAAELRDQIIETENSRPE